MSLVPRIQSENPQKTTSVTWKLFNAETERKPEFERK
jgi:hypothetical protein